MGNFQLQYRHLLKDEKIILFGRNAENIPAIQALDVENYLAFLEAVYNGEELSFPEITTDTATMYVYCDLPAGSLDLFKVSKEPGLHNKVYDTPMSFVNYTMNSLFIPVVNKAISVISDTPYDASITPNMLYSSVNIRYSPLSDTLLSGMFITLCKGTVVSVASFAAFKSHIAAIDTYTYPNFVDEATETELQEVYAQLHFDVPASVLPDINIPAKFINSVSNLVSKKQLLVSTFSDNLNWCNNNIVIAAKYISFSGFLLHNETPYLTIDACNTSPFAYGGNASLSNTFDQLMTALKNSEKTTQFVLNSIGKFYAFSGNHSYEMNGGQSFVFLNSDNLTSTTATRSCGVPERIELNKDFFDSVRDIYKDNEDLLANNQEARLKARKTEFSHKKESVISETDTWNRRYISLKNKDKKLLVYTKTSLAKEAAKKMAITRKISTAISPVVDMAIRLLSVRDFQTGLEETDRKMLFPITTSLTYSQPKGAGTAYLKSNNLVDAFNTKHDAALLAFSKINKKLSSDVISSLYTDTSYEGTPFWECLKTVPNATTYKANFTHIGQSNQEAQVFSYAASYYLMFFNQFLYDGAKPYSNYFSPFSGNIDLIKLGQTLYFNSKDAKFKSGLEFLANRQYSNNLTGKQLYYFYNNNFISADQGLYDEIDKRKNDEYVYLTNSSTPALSSFSCSQEALDSFTALKKSKTFTDYSAWFKTIKPTLETINKDTFEADEYAIFKVNSFLLNTYESMLDELSLQETPYLPKEEPPKKRGRKAAEAIAILLEPNPPTVATETETDVADTLIGEKNDPNPELAVDHK